MPIFSAPPSRDIGSAIRRALASQNAVPLAEMQGDMAAAQTTRNIGLAEQARAHVEKMRAETAALEQAQRDRVDPQLATEYAGNVAGINAPEAQRMNDHIRGVLEQPAPADVDDAMTIGREAQPFPTGKPNLEPGQERLFRSALASTFANRLATGKTNAEQLARAGGDINTEALTSQAANEPNPEVANPIIAAIGRHLRQPYKVGPQGQVLNSEAGTVDEGTELAQAVKRLRGAQTAAATASAAKSTAAAGGAPNASDEPSAVLPGGTGSKLMQEAESGTKYAVNEKTGRAWKATENGWEPMLVTNLPKNLQKFGAGGATAGNREAVFNQRVIQSANQASKDLGNITKLPLASSSTGVFGGRKQGPGLLDAGKEVLANKMTGQDAQTYNVMATGFQRSLAAIESAGLMPSGSLTHQMDAVLFKEGDSNLTKLQKLAQIRQIVESGMETLLNNPRVSDMEKNHAKSIVASLQKSVPFTQENLIELMKQQETNPDITLKDVVGKVPASGAAALPAGWKIEKVQ